MANNTNTATSALENSNNSNNDNLQDKRFLLESLTVGTHPFVFHADDVCAVAIINLFRGEYALPPVKVVRSRDPKVWDSCDVLIDVGEGEYDHHGASYSIGQWADAPLIPSCGFSKVLEAISKFQDWRKSWWNALDDTAKAVSCFDNGKPELLPEGLSSPFSWVHGMNIPWNADNKSVADYDIAFENAVHIAEQILKGLIATGLAAWEAEEEHERILAKGADELFSVRIPAGLPNWQKTVCQFWDADFVYYEGVDGTWYIQCVPETAEDIFSKRKPLPQEWAILRDQELGEKIQAVIPEFDPAEAVFCHKDIFMMGVRSYKAVRLILSYLSKKA